jgi:hypothetical protein
VFAGWRADTSVPRVVDEHRDAFASLPAVLVATLDSGRSGTWLGWHALDGHPRVVSRDPVVVTGSFVVETLLDGGMLNGFDELWVMPAIGPFGPFPEDATIVGPQRLGAAVPAPVAAWIRASGARLGLGDGDGLNFAGTDHELSRALGLAAALPS